MFHSAFVRLFEPRYSDGKELSAVATDGSELPNARLAITTLISDKNVPDTVSLIVAQWAQFIAHDFAASVSKSKPYLLVFAINNKSSTAGESDCCADGVDPKICMPITIPEDDAWFSQFNRTCLSLTRNENVLTGDCSEDGFKTPVRNFFSRMPN